MTRIACPWCSRPFTPRRSGGKPQRFCSPQCRRAFERELRAWARDQIAADGIPPAQLQRPRSIEATSHEGHPAAARTASPSAGPMRALSSPKN
jgi:endogenous inhibitor of DNA gyrase (YacG/DUF329 family)